eukprot:gene2716-549_t
MFYCPVLPCPSSALCCLIHPVWGANAAAAEPIPAGQATPTPLLATAFNIQEACYTFVGFALAIGLGAGNGDPHSSGAQAHMDPYFYMISSLTALGGLLYWLRVRNKGKGEPPSRAYRTELHAMYDHLDVFASPESPPTPRSPSHVGGSAARPGFHIRTMSSAADGSHHVRTSSTFDGSDEPLSPTAFLRGTSASPARFPPAFSAHFRAASYDRLSNQSE